MRSQVSHTTLGLVLAQVLQELFVGLVGNEPQCQFPQRDQVIGAEEMSQCLADLLTQVDIALHHPATELLR